MGVLLVGLFVGCLLVYVWNVLVVGVYYMEGYLLVFMFEDDVFEFFFVVLLVLGGYLMLVKVEGIG